MKTPKFAALALSLLAATASAQTVTVRDEKGQETTAPTEAASRDTAADEAATLQPQKPHSARSCLMLTGSRITTLHNQRAAREGRKDRECATSTGRSYSKEDLDSTGRRDVAEALRALDAGIH